MRAMRRDKKCATELLPRLLVHDNPSARIWSALLALEMGIDISAAKEALR
jgi:hypothetical protein